MLDTILNLMEDFHVTAKQMTSDLGMSGSAISEWKKGKGKPSTDAVVKIAKYFQVSTDYILGVDIKTKESNAAFWNQYIDICKAIGKAPSAFADEVGIELSTLAGWKNGVAPKESDLIKLAKYLDISPRDLVGEKKERPTLNARDGLSDMEQELIRLFKELNQEGQEQLVDTADTMVSSGKYKKSGAAELGEKQA